MTKVWQFLFVFSFLLAYISVSDGKSIGKLPSFVHTCKKNDPQLNDCLKKFFESFKTTFTTGVPEVGIPVMDPYKKDNLVFKLPGKGKNRVESSDVTIHGLKDLDLQEVSINPETYQIKIKATIKSLSVEGKYDVDAVIMSMAVKGKGPFSGSANDIALHVTADGKLIEKDGEKVLHIENGDGEVSWKTHHLNVQNLFPEKKANDAFNQMVNGNVGKSLVRSQMPVFKQIIVTSVIQYVNEIVERFPIDTILQP